MLLFFAAIFNVLLPVSWMWIVIAILELKSDTMKGQRNEEVSGKLKAPD